MKVMILAAGLGKRMRPLTEHTPKPLLRAGGKALLEHHLLRLSAAGFREVVINVSHLAEQVEAFCGDGSAWGVAIQWSREERPLETAGRGQAEVPQGVLGRVVDQDQVGAPRGKPPVAQACQRIIGPDIAVDHQKGRVAQ